MRRLARHALNALTALSLLLCVATLGLWVRSYWRQDRFSLRTATSGVAQRSVGLYSSRGSLVFDRQQIDFSWAAGVSTHLGAPPLPWEWAIAPAREIHISPRGMAHFWNVLHF